MLKHVLTGLAVVAMAGALASCGGTDVVYTQPAPAAAVVVPQPGVAVVPQPGVAVAPGTVIIEDDD